MRLLQPGTRAPIWTSDDAAHNLPLFAPLEADPQGAWGGVHDMSNMPLEAEPQRVRDDLAALRRSVLATSETR